MKFIEKFTEMINNSDQLPRSLEQTIKENSDKINNLLNSGKVEDYFNYIKDLIFDNLLFITIFIILIVPSMIYKVGLESKFNWWMLLIIPGIMLLNYIIKIVYRRYTNLGNKMRANQCLEKTAEIIVNKQVKPIETKPYLLDKPINEFLINTSHNTYVPCTQNADIASTEAIKRVLGMGARVIELDCYAKNNTGTSEDDMTPVVAHGAERSAGDIFTTSYVKFEDCINTIADFGFLTSDPLIICLELNTNNLLPVQKKMKEIIKEKLGNKLLSSEYKYSYSGPNKKVFTIEPIKNLLNKVIFISGGGATSELDDILDGNLGDSSMMGNAPHTAEGLKNMNRPGIMHRVYPDGDIYGHLSYNYDPTELWKNRYQLVALNFQVLDNNMMKNVAMFSKNSFVHFTEI